MTNIVKIPIKIASEANSTDHWTKKSKRHKVQKAIVNAYFQRLTIPSLPAAITLTRHAPRPYDDDNIRAAFKYIRDAVSEYILSRVDNKIYRAGRADNDARLTWVYSQQQTTHEEYFVTIQIDSLQKESHQ